MKLKKIFENLDKIPSKGFSDIPKLSLEQKKKLMEMVSNYNNLGQCLKNQNDLVNTSKTLSEIAEMAEIYACNEANDWFQTETIKNDFKRARGISESFQKLSRECYSKLQQLNALYEDLGHVLNRYFEISDPVAEICPNPSNEKSQKELPQNGPSKEIDEVSPNTSNLQSQRELPQSGPESYTPPTPEEKNKYVTFAGTGDPNLKKQRDEPQNGPAPSQIKETNQPNIPKLSDILKLK